MTRGDELEGRKGTVDSSGDIRLDVDGRTESYRLTGLGPARRVALTYIRKGLAREVVLWRAWVDGPDGRERLGVYRA